MGPHQPKTKGHWPKGKSRKLPAARVATARTLLDVLRRAIARPYHHPTLGPLSYRVAAAFIGCDPKTVHRWCKGERLPAEWALAKIRELVRNFKD
jgi:hypothetical protein